MTTLKTQPFDMANHLRNEEEIAEYLRQVLQDNNPAELAGALGDIARARGMTQLARDTGLSRESLYKSLSGERAPSRRWSWDLGRTERRHKRLLSTHEFVRDLVLGLPITTTTRREARKRSYWHHQQNAIKTHRLGHDQRY